MSRSLATSSARTRPSAAGSGAAWAAGNSATVVPGAPGQPPVIIPPSSVERPGDQGRRAHTNTRTLQLPQGARPPSTRAPQPQISPGSGYKYETPASLACVYGLAPAASGCNPNQVAQNAAGGSKAIAIVDAYDDPTAASDLQAYSAQFGLPAVTSLNFQVVYAAGANAKPAFDSGWQGEEALDVEMAHALAPTAKIILVEAASNAYSDMLQAENVAASAVAGGGEVSNSWGGTEFSGETTSAYTAPFAASGVVFFASTGDNRKPSYPAVLPTVVAVGGTSILRTSAGDFTAEASWSSAGAGPSAYVPRPAFQNAVASIVGTKRGVADIAADANPNTGVWVYVAGGWQVYGGTSVASPIVAAITNAAGHFLGSTTSELQTIYANRTTAFYDVKQGRCGRGSRYAAVAGYDFCTGVGSPRGLSGE
jgi:subtilase family serine protease